MPDNKKQELAGKMPPHNLEAERAVLGALLIDSDAIIKVADFLGPADFYKDAHKKIYTAMLELYGNHDPLDVLSVSSRLQEKKQIEYVGGRSYLAGLANEIATSAHVVQHAKIVQKKSTLNNLIKAATEITQLGYHEEEEIQQILDKAESRLFGVTQNLMKNKFSSMKDLLGEAFDRIDELHKDSGKLRGLSSGFYELDNMMAGFQKSDLIILAARPSMGKTSLALDFVRHIALKEKKPVGIFSLEMGKEQLVDKMLCAEAGIDLWKMRTGKLSDQEDINGESDFSKIGHAMGRLAEAKIFIDDSPTANVMEIRTKARRLQAEHGISFIILDYLQLMESSSNTDNRVQIVSEISRGLKAVARELNVPIIALSQLSRQVESRPTPIPKLADLRESGSIEQDADIVMFIYRDKYYKKDSPRGDETDIYIAKHRNGPTGVVTLYFEESKAKFKNLAKNLEESQVPAEA